MTSMSYNCVCQFNATAAGTANFGVASAVSGFLTPEQAGATNGKVYFYIAKTPDGLWEWGSGGYSYSTHTVARTTITSTSLGTTSPINFLTTPIVVVFSSPAPSLEQPFPSGTVMLFMQQTAPVGWTRFIGYGDRALRISDSTLGIGGSYGFSTVFSQSQVGNTTLSVGQMAQHAHGPLSQINGFFGPYVGITGFGPYGLNGGTTGDASADGATGYQGSNQAHTHSILLQLAYADIMIATKN